MHSDKKRCADTLSLSRQAEQNRAEERVSIDTKKGSKYNKSNEKRGGGIQLKKRKWKFRIAGGAVTLLGIYLMAVGYGETITLTIATVVLIFGIAIWSMATPENYNSMTDMIAMISMEKPRKIEEFYEAYKNVDTPFGSAWLAKFYTMRQKALVFGPDAKGEYLYFWLTKDGHVGYLGYSFIEGFIKKKLTTPVYPIHEDVAENLADHLSYHSDLMMFQSELKANLEHFVKTGTVQPFQKISASQIYTFTEDYRLTGQHFDLEDTDGNLVYEIDSTVPLKTFYIYDAMHTEIFRMTKELLHALPTYRFYLYGEPYGVLKKQFALVRDQFSMELPGGKTGTPGIRRLHRPQLLGKTERNYDRRHRRQYGSYRRKHHVRQCVSDCLRCKISAAADRTRCDGGKRTGTRQGRRSFQSVLTKEREGNL